MENNEIKEVKQTKKKSGSGLATLVVILALVVMGMGAFIFLNKDKLMSKEEASVEKASTNSKTKVDTKSNTGSNTESTKDCPEISYTLKTNEYGFRAGNVGISVSIDSTRTSAQIAYNGATINNSFGLGWTTAADTTTYETIDTKTFNKKIAQVLIDGAGQSSVSSAILYLMEDGTVEYVPILKDINTNWRQADNTKKFNSYGKLEGVSDVISLIPAEASGYHTVLARKADGTVINLSNALNATGNFQ